AEETERELIAGLADPRIRHLDYFTDEVDHYLHANHDAATQRYELEKIDALIGRIWTAIQKSPLADETMLVLVSDHGMNSGEKIYSQAYDLVSLLGCAAGGGHHVVTKGPPLMNHTIKGLDPFAGRVTTPATESLYLKDRSAQYPTALLDLDGNERASLHLRDSDLNLLHILWQQLGRTDLAPPLRRAAIEAFFATVERRRAQWGRTRDELQAELEALRRVIAGRQKFRQSQPKQRSDLDARREIARLNIWREEERAYSCYLRTLTRLLALRRKGFDPTRVKINEVIAPRAMGEANTIHQLQNYVVGLAPAGLALDSNGGLDLSRSFQRIDYFALLRSISVRNNPQPGVTNRPVDFIAVRIPQAALTSALSADEMPDRDTVWLDGGDERQALLLARGDAGGGLQLRYLPVARLNQQADGTIRLTRARWPDGLPLKLWEDEKLGVPAANRAEWLQQWHSETEWLRATHETKYSNAVIGLHEHFLRPVTETMDDEAAPSSGDERLLR